MNDKPLFEVEGIDEPIETKSSKKESLQGDFNTRIITTNADEAYAETLASLLDCGDKVLGGKSSSIGSEKECHEILNFMTVINNPQQRLIYNASRKLNLPAAIARFVWMMAGNDRLDDIAFYEPKVRFFTDDGISVPGSNYGQRMLHPRPGLNQLSAVINRLKSDSQSRRAAISIYHPEDAVRESHDIPCTFGLFYHVRNGKLFATTIMRSNNAYILLPYNIFEFSLLAEVVAVEIGVPLGAQTHFAASMHIYEHDVEGSKRVVDSYRSENTSESGVPIPSMPSEPKPLDQIKELVILESDLRHNSQGLTGNNIEEWITKGQEKLNSYWQQYYFLLLLYVVTQKSTYLKANSNQQEIALSALESVFAEPWKSYLPKDAFKAQGSKLNSIENIAPLEIPNVNQGAQVIFLHDFAAHKQLRERVNEYESKTKTEVNWKAFANLQERFADRIAARDGEPVSYDEVERVLSELVENDEK